MQKPAIMIIGVRQLHTVVKIVSMISKSSIPLMQCAMMAVINKGGMENETLARTFPSVQIHWSKMTSNKHKVMSANPFCAVLRWKAILDVMIGCMIFRLDQRYLWKYYLVLCGLKGTLNLKNFGDVSHAVERSTEKNFKTIDPARIDIGEKSKIVFIFGFMF